MAEKFYKWPHQMTLEEKIAELRDVAEFDYTKEDVWDTRNNDFYNGKQDAARFALIIVDELLKK